MGDPLCPPYNLSQAQEHLNPPVCSSWRFGVRVTLDYLDPEHSDNTCIDFFHTNNFSNSLVT